MILATFLPRWPSITTTCWTTAPSGTPRSRFSYNYLNQFSGKYERKEGLAFNCLIHCVNFSCGTPWKADDLANALSLDIKYISNELSTDFISEIKFSVRECTWLWNIFAASRIILHPCNPLSSPLFILEKKYTIFLWFNITEIDFQGAAPNWSWNNFHW